MLLGTADPNHPPAALVAVKLASGWSAAPLVYLLGPVLLSVLWGRLE